eukprot:scaffold50805_cov31-Tisochrysis_lutea.AAC.11
MRTHGAPAGEQQQHKVHVRAVLLGAAANGSARVAETGAEPTYACVVVVDSWPSDDAAERTPPLRFLGLAGGTLRALTPPCFLSQRRRSCPCGEGDR